MFMLLRETPLCLININVHKWSSKKVTLFICIIVYEMNFQGFNQGQEPF